MRKPVDDTPDCGQLSGARQCRVLTRLAQPFPGGESSEKGRRTVRGVQLAFRIDGR